MVLDISSHSALTSWEFYSQREMGNKPAWVKQAEISPSKPCVVTHSCCTASSWCLCLAKGRSYRGINNK